MKMLASVIALAALAGCAPRSEPGDTVQAQAHGEVLPEGQQAIRGTVRIVGSAPVNVQVVLRPESGGAVRLTGPLRPELERLAGIEVTVTGRVTPSPDPLADRELEATAYEIGMVNGRSVLVGELVAVGPDGATLRTADGTEVQLRGVPTGFRPGQKVWVQGPASVVVQSFGVLRP